MGINAFGIDLGSSNIRIYNGNDDSYMMEKNMIAIEGRDTLFAYGDSAYEMYEKAPDNISVSYPVVNGVIADIVNMNTLVHYFISDLGGGSIRPADYYITVPDDVTEVEQRAFYDLILDSNVKARNVYTVQKACADAVGMDIDVKNSQGIFIVDVGFQTTEISLLSLGGIVASRLISGHISHTEQIEIERMMNTGFVCSGLNFEKVIFLAIGPTIIKSRTKATGIIIGSSWNAIRKTELETPPIASAML